MTKKACMLKLLESHPAQLRVNRKKERCNPSTTTGSSTSLPQAWPAWCSWLLEASSADGPSLPKMQGSQGGLWPGRMPLPQTSRQDQNGPRQENNQQPLNKMALHHNTQTSKCMLRGVFIILSRNNWLESVKHLAYYTSIMYSTEEYFTAKKQHRKRPPLISKYVWNWVWTTGQRFIFMT